MQIPRFLSLWMPVAAWAGLIFTLSSIPHLHTELGTWDLILRKIAHMIEFGVLALLIARALRGARTGMDSPRALLWAAVASAGYAVSDEFHQSFVPGRGASPLDVGIDACGIALSIWIFRCLTAFWSGRKNHSGLAKAREACD